MCSYVYVSFWHFYNVLFCTLTIAEPLPPVDGSSPSAGVTSVRLQWETPSGIVTFYRVTINPTLDTDQNFIEVTNLLPGTDYNVSIVAISGTGLYQQISDPIEFRVITGKNVLFNPNQTWGHYAPPPPPPSAIFLIVQEHLKINSSSGKKKKINSHRIKQNLQWMFKITNKWHVPNNFGRKCILAE